MTPEERFWPRVSKSEGCWEWTGPRYPNGYGMFSYQGRTQGTHRVAWMLTHGPIPDGLQVLHRCDNRPCVRPDHLFLGTQADNLRDCRAKGRFRQFSKLTTEQRSEIHRRYAQGETQEALGREFNVSHRHIGRLVDGRGKGWRPAAAPKGKPCRGCGGPKLPGKGRKYCGRC